MTAAELGYEYEEFARISSSMLVVLRPSRPVVVVFFLFISGEKMTVLDFLLD